MYYIMICFIKYSYDDLVRLSLACFVFACVDCSQMCGHAQHALLFHTDVQWLSKGNMIKRLHELKMKLQYFSILGSKIYWKSFDSKAFNNHWLIL